MRCLCFGLQCLLLLPKKSASFIALEPCRFFSKMLADFFRKCLPIFFDDESKPLPKKKIGKPPAIYHTCSF
jgi:hypothetical protein